MLGSQRQVLCRDARLAGRCRHERYHIRSTMGHALLSDSHSAVNDNDSGVFFKGVLPLFVATIIDSLPCLGRSRTGCDGPFTRSLLQDPDARAASRSLCVSLVVDQPLRRKLATSGTQVKTEAFTAYRRYALCFWCRKSAYW